MFLDIEEAFDKTTFKSIELALEEHDVNHAPSRWMTGMLKNREVLINVGDTEIDAFEDTGCSQGGVISPVLWYTVVDSLIRHLNDLSYQTIGYANDIVILLTGNNADRLCALVEEWCSR